MAHKDWCGENCGECDGCELDSTLYCFPCCGDLMEDGSIDVVKCKDCDSCKAYLEDLDNSLIEEEE